MLLWAYQTQAQRPGNVNEADIPGTTEMSFEEYEPVSTLVVPEHPTTRAKYPFIDVHNHQFRMPTQDLDALTAEMDKLNMAVMVNLSGRGRGSQQHLKGALENVRKHHPNRFIVFTNISFAGIDEPDWAEKTCKYLEEDVALGANGLKIYKSLGLTATDAAGKRIAVDDPRLDPVWAKCGELGIPVLIHTGEPASFWKPRDKYNERWLELIQRPNRYRSPDKYPSWEQVMSEQHHVFRKHPNTIFINAHLGWMGNDLARLGKLLDECPNVYTEIGAVLAELGRQPRFARQWLIKYQDRVCFGKDSWRPEEYHVYFRVLETADEYFDYYRKRHAFWKMYGLDLPDEVLKKLYYKNALKIIPNIDASLFPD
ncbi:MAG: amidohydrolase [Bacteroidetes bacterium]|nr:MAG: amidohydrolase [Bacteroidota bacterium]